MTEQKKNKVQEITEKLPEQIQQVFESEKYKDYLKVMSKFTHYSINNSILIAMQRPDASLVAGYEAWKQKFDRHVKAGSKGIQIIQPAPYRKKVEQEVLDSKGNIKRNPDGTPLMEQIEKIIPAFKVAYVFDINDTEGAPLPSIVQHLNDDVFDFDGVMDVIQTISPVPITFEDIDSGANGFYNLESKDIHIKNGMGQMQTIKTSIHEIAHSILHDRDTGTDLNVDRNTKEVEAESVAYVVANYYGWDTSDYSFGYIAEWSKNKNLEELKQSLDTIRKTADQIIDSIDMEIMNRRLEQEQELAYKLPSGEYLYIQSIDDGYDFSIYNREGMLLDGGIIEDKFLRIDNAAEEALKMLDRKIDGMVPHQVEHLQQLVEKANTIVLVQPPIVEQKIQLKMSM